MNAKVTLQSGEERLTISTPRPYPVGTSVLYEGKQWIVTSYEYMLKRRIPPFEMVTSRVS